MKRTTIPMAACALLSAACGGTRPAEGPSPDPVLTAAAWQPPIASLLGERARLGLASEQVVALDSISRSWGLRHDTLSRAAREARGRAGPGGGGMERARPAIEAMVENHRRAAAAVAEVLDERQRGIACELQAERRQAMRGAPGRRPPAGGGRAQGRGGARPPETTGAQAGAGMRGWPWCRAPEPDAEPR